MEERKMSQNNNTTDLKFDLEPLDDIIRKWAVMSQWEKDLENYEKLKNDQNENIQFGYN